MSPRTDRYRLCASHGRPGFASICMMLIMLGTSFPGLSAATPPVPLILDESDQDQDEILFPMKQGGKWGYINREGKVVIEPAYDYANLFHDGRALVKVGKKFGYIDGRGILVVPPKYAIAGSFSEGLAAVTKSDGFLWPKPMGELRGPARVAYIDTSGKVVIKSKYYGEVREAGFHDGRALVRLEALHVRKESFGGGRRNGYIDKTVEFAILPEYEMANPFSDGLAKVWKDERAMFIDMAGKVVIDVTDYTYTGSFSEGLASVAQTIRQDGKDVNKIGFINSEGKLVIPLEYDRVGEFSEGLAAVAIGWNHPTFVPKGQKYIPAKWGYIDKTGKRVIEFQYWWANPFSEGLARVKLEEGGKPAVIDRQGKVVIPPKFDSVGSFHNGLASVTLGNRWEEYEAPGITEGRRLVLGKMGYIDKSGKYVWDSTE